MEISKETVLQAAKIGFCFSLVGLVGIFVTMLSTEVLLFGNPLRPEIALYSAALSGFIVRDVSQVVLYSGVVVMLLCSMFYIVPALKNLMKKPESDPVISGLLMASNGPDVALPTPHTFLFQYQYEPFEGYCERVAVAQKKIALSTQICVAMPYQRDTLLVVGMNSRMAETARRESGLIDESDYPVEFDCTRETYPQYIAAAELVAANLRVGISDFVRKFSNDGSGYQSEILDIGGRAAQMAFRMVLPLLFTVPGFGQIVERVQEVVPYTVLTKPVSEKTDVFFTFQKLTFNRTGDGKKTPIQLLTAPSSFRDDANVGAFVGLTIGDKIYNNTHVAADKAVTVSRADAAAPVNEKKTVNLQETVQGIDAATIGAFDQLAQSSSIVRKSKTWELLFYLIAFFAFFFRAVAMAASSEYMHGVSSYFGVIAEKCRVICFVLYWSWGLYVGGLFFWIGFYYQDLEQVVSLVFSIYSLAIITLIVIMETLSRGSMWFTPNIKPQQNHNPNRGTIFVNNEPKKLNG
jgi:hypothetical protein